MKQAQVRPLALGSLILFPLLFIFAFNAQGQPTPVDDLVLDLHDHPFERAADVSAPAGEQKWASLLCKFSDVSSEPQPKSFFKEMFERTSGPSLTSYWNEVSYGTISSVTTDVFGWYTLPGTRADYNFGGADRQFDFDKILQDCANAAAGDVDVFSYDYYAVFLNSDHSVAISHIGSSGPVMPSNKFNLATMPHEMGHTYGLPHSQAGGSETQNIYDLMSAHRYNCEAAADPVYFCLAQHPAAHFKAQLGFIDQEQQYMASGPKTIILERLAQPQTDNYLIAYVPDPTTGGQYSVEARMQVGLDSKIPQEGVVIHKLDGFGLGATLELIDGDNNGNFEDEGAIWKPGETFETEDGISISVLASTGTGYEVKIIAPGAAIESELSIDKTTLAAGEELNGSLELINIGTEASQSMAVVLQSPNNATLVPGSLQTTAGIVDEPNLYISIPAIPSNQSVTITFAYTVDAGLTDPTVLNGLIEFRNNLFEITETLPITAIVNPISQYLPNVQR